MSAIMQILMLSMPAQSPLGRFPAATQPNRSTTFGLKSACVVYRYIQNAQISIAIDHLREWQIPRYFILG